MKQVRLIGGCGLGAPAVMGVGALVWFAGNLLWLVGQPIYRAVPWWIAFLVLTVAGERLELARVLLLRRMTRLSFLACSALVVAGLVLSFAAPTAGIWLSGLGLLSLGAWLLCYDLARRTVRQAGLTRFIALCLLPGYGWLAFAGLTWMVWADRFIAGPWYDAMLHAVTLGFIFSMIFGHAPLILPAVTGRPLLYRPYFYSHKAYSGRRSRDELPAARFWIMVYGCASTGKKRSCTQPSDCNRKYYSKTRRSRSSLLDLSQARSSRRTPAPWRFTISWTAPAGCGWTESTLLSGLGQQ